MKTQGQLLSQVMAFNTTYDIGDRVKLEMDNGEIKVCTLKHKAELLGGHSAVAWFEEISGCYSIDRMRM